MPVEFQFGPIHSSARAGFRLIPFLITSALLLSCATNGTGASFTEGSFREVFADPGPITLVILPFESQAEGRQIASLMRTALYSQLSPKNFRDLEPTLVDQLLHNKEETSGTEWRNLSPVELGNLLGTELLIYGNIINYQKSFLGIYSQIVLTVGLEMVSCRTGEIVWQMTLTRRSHDGGVPFSPLALVPAAFRSGLHMKHHRTVALVDRVSRELAAVIPDPPPPLPVRQSFELQVASFLNRGKADKAMRSFGEDGAKARIETVSMDGRIFHRVILGPFPSGAEAEKAKARIMEKTAFRPILIHVNESD